MRDLSERQLALLSAALDAYRAQCANDAAANLAIGRGRVAEQAESVVAKCDELSARLADSSVAISVPAEPAEPAEPGPIEFGRGSS